MARARVELGIQDPDLPVPLVGSLTTYEQVRSTILQRKLLTRNPREPHEVSNLPFMPPRELMADWKTVMTVPQEVAAWSYDSRRVFRLDPDLQLMLEGMHVEKLKFSDVPWPFPSFAIKLAAPIKNKNNIEHDTLLISQEPYTGTITIRAIRSDISEFSLSDIMREGVLLAVESGNAENYRSLSDEWWRKVVGFLRDRYPMEQHIPPWAHDELITKFDSSRYWQREQLGEGFRMVYGHSWEWDHRAGGVAKRGDWLLIQRLVAGLCLYIDSLPSGSTHVEKIESPEPERGLIDPRAITTEAAIFTVSNVHVLSGEVRRFLRRNRVAVMGGYELSSHFRRGHWRVRPGRAGDPKAKKTVKVLPAVVREDRLAEGALASGTRSNVK